MAYTEEQTSVNKLMENEKVGKGNYVTFEGNYTGSHLETMIFLITYDIKKIIFIKKISNSLESARKVCFYIIFYRVVFLFCFSSEKLAS
jgi:hypothetical protein